MTENGAEEINRTAATALELIQSAFAHRARPKKITDSKQLSDSEYDEVMSFEGLKWQEVSVALVEQAPDAVFWFSPEAFCYYLPGVLSAGFSTGRCDLLYFDSLIGCLDRSPEPDCWDDFFYPRFTLLSPEEIAAVSAWAIGWSWLNLTDTMSSRINGYKAPLSCSGKGRRPDLQNESIFWWHLRNLSSRLPPT